MPLASYPILMTGSYDQGLLTAALKLYGKCLLLMSRLIPMILTLSITSFVSSCYLNTLIL